MFKINDVNKAQDLGSSGKTRKTAGGSDFSSYLRETMKPGEAPVSGVGGISVSDAVLRAWQAFGRLRDEKALKGWLIKITVNCAHEHHRKTARLTYTDDLEPLAGGAEDRHDFTLWDAVCALPEDYRVATVLFYYEDMTTAEIAKVLAVREGTVRSRLSRARNRLRTLLEEE